MKCECCAERKATLKGLYYGESVNGCSSCLKKCDTDGKYYYVEEIVKCFICGRNKHESEYSEPTDITCTQCGREIDEEESHFPYRPIDV